MKNRTRLQQVIDKQQGKIGRIIVLTGARQTGKTTLVKQLPGDYTYISLDDPLQRPHFASLSSVQWHTQYPQAILDEVQKLPQLFESVKAVCDAYDDSRFVLLGSSQILLMENIRESLAGRATIFELFPLTLPERNTRNWQDAVRPSRMVQWLVDPDKQLDIFDGFPIADELYCHLEMLFQDYLTFGGMPIMTDSDLSPNDKREWLGDYIKTYLQRDIRDLANMRELEPFVLAQKTLFNLTGQQLNYSKLSALSGVTAKTAKRFITYLEASYQVLSLPPWFRNLSKRLSKAPKVHVMDPGIHRAVTNRQGELNGHEFESAVVAEIYKQLKNCKVPVDLFHLRTLDGREVDLLLESEAGFIPIEIKQTSKVTYGDARHLRNLEQFLDKPIIHSFVLSNDPTITQLDDTITALPVSWFLGPSRC